jgi:hypothetical protein
MNIPALLFAAGFFGRTKSATTPVQRKMSGADGLEASRSRQDRVTVPKASGQPRVGLALTVTNEQTVSVETRNQGSWMFLAEGSTDHRRDQCAARTVLPSADQTPEAATDKPQAKELIKIALSPTRPALEKKTRSKRGSDPSGEDRTSPATVAGAVRVIISGVCLQAVHGLSWCRRASSQWNTSMRSPRIR